MEIYVQLIKKSINYHPNLSNCQGKKNIVSHLWSSMVTSNQQPPIWLDFLNPNIVITNQEKTIFLYLLRLRMIDSDLTWGSINQIFLHHANCERQRVRSKTFNLKIESSLHPVITNWLNNMVIAKLTIRCCYCFQLDYME